MKESMAFFVYRKGAYCSNGEIIAALWEDDGRSLGITSEYIFTNIWSDRTIEDEETGEDAPQYKQKNLKNTKQSS